MLDRNLPFGEVHGSTKGVKYYQSTDGQGRYYNVDGYEVNHETGVRIEKIAPPGKKKPATEQTQEPADEDIIVDGVNLTLFVKGELPATPADKIKAAVEKHFGKKPKTLTEALDIAKGNEV